jgi:hypothetical protein
MLGKVPKMTREQLDFAVFCVESVAERLGLSGDAAYKMLAQDSSILDEYVIAHYDVLHTQGKEYIVDDIMGYMKEEGVL